MQRHHITRRAAATWILSRRSSSTCIRTSNNNDRRAMTCRRYLRNGRPAPPPPIQPKNHTSSRTSCRLLRTPTTWTTPPYAATSSPPSSSPPSRPPHPTKSQQLHWRQKSASSPSSPPPTTTWSEDTTVKAAAATPIHTSNITPSIAALVGRDLHLNENHPIGIIKQLIVDALQAQQHPDNAYTVIDTLPPRVTAKQNFDDLLIPADHVSRAVSDTFYFDPPPPSPAAQEKEEKEAAAHGAAAANTAKQQGHQQQLLLRTHTSAHQSQFLQQGLDAFLVVGDCYRRDEIDASHYPVFHQMEGVRIFDPAKQNAINTVDHVVQDLKHTLTGLARALFGQDKEIRFNDDYFPFTHPSFELEVLFNGQWIEVLGSGVIQQQILFNAGREKCLGWAFGLGLERLAMVLFQIPDIRLFWSQDMRFAKQFKAGIISQFEPFSKYPPCFKDVSFWLPSSPANKLDDIEDDASGEEAVATTSGQCTTVHENDVAQVVRDVAGDLVEEMRLVDEFVHPKTQRKSVCYRITYRSLERSLLNEEVDAIQERVREALHSTLGVELR